jgi:hypothetical protein
MRNVILVSLLLLMSWKAAAQQKPAYSAQVLAGMLVGESGSGLQVQLINGVKWNKWFSGIGTSIDWYYKRTVPVFVSVNRSLLTKGKNTLLLTGDAGINFPWEESYINYSIRENGTNQKAGLYWAGGVGYQFGVGKGGNAVQLNLGYSYKQSKEDISFEYPCFNPPCIPVVESYDYRLKRLSIRLGWIF